LNIQGNKGQHALAIIGSGRISSKHIEAAVNTREALGLVACCDPVVERAAQRRGDIRRQGDARKRAPQQLCHSPTG